MPRYILKIKDKYCEYSTVVDAPVTPLLPRETFLDFASLTQTMRAHYEAACAIADDRGASSRHVTLEDIEKENRAGENEAQLSLDEIYLRYAQ